MKRFLKELLSFLLALTITCVFAVYASAAYVVDKDIDASPQKFYYEEVEPNNSVSNANILVSPISDTTKRLEGSVAIGSISSSDINDYYKLTIPSNTRVYVKCMPRGVGATIPSSSTNIMLKAYDSNGTLITSSNNSTVYSEFLYFETGYFAAGSADYYIQVNRLSGSTTITYSLYTSFDYDNYVDNGYISQSLYAAFPNSDTYMYQLGANCADHHKGYVFLYFGAMAKSTSNGVTTYGAYTFNGLFL